MEIERRTANVSMVPVNNHEYMQVLRYKHGQYYQIHHDYIPGHNGMPIGPRLLTLYIYLSNVTAGGRTAFPHLNTPLAVEPLAGAAIIWPSVVDEDVWKKDGRTMHEAQPVEEGTKFGINAWLHLYNFREPHTRACTG